MNTSRLRTAALLVGLSLVGMPPAFPQAREPSPDEARKAIGDRRAAMGTLIRNAPRTEVMVYGMAPWRADEALQSAEELARQAASAYDLFPPGTMGPDSKAKPEIWTQVDLFQQRAESSRRSIASLVAAARGGSLEAVKSAYVLVTPACVACHTDFMRN